VSLKRCYEAVDSIIQVGVYCTLLAFVWIYIFSVLTDIFIFTFFF